MSVCLENGNGCVRCSSRCLILLGHFHYYLCPMSLKKILSENLVSSSVGLLFTGLTALLVTVFGDWNTVGQALVGAWDYVTASTAVPRWAVAIVSIWTALTTIILVAIRLQASGSGEDWRSYRTDNFYNMRWSWIWSGDSQPYNLSVFCPVCDYQLDCCYDSAYTAIDAIRYECHCGAGPWRFEESQSVLNNRVKKLVQQRVRTGQWQQPQRAST